MNKSVTPVPRHSISFKNQTGRITLRHAATPPTNACKWGLTNCPVGAVTWEGSLQGGHREIKDVSITGPFTFAPFTNPADGVGGTIHFSRACEVFIVYYTLEETLAMRKA